MTPFRAEHCERSHSFTVALPVAEAFRLFEPEGERRWAEGWDPRYLHPADGRATLVSASETAVARLDEVNGHRRKYLDERLGDWSDDDVLSFVDLLARYNAALEE